MTKDLKAIGKNLRKIRESAKRSQTEAAAFLGVDQSYICKAERGERPLGMSHMTKLAAYYCCPLEALLNADNPTRISKVAFRSDAITAQDEKMLAKVNQIILNQIEMEELFNAGQ